MTNAKKQGVLIQLKSNGVSGQIGTYRTNVGVVNPNSVTANVTWRLYDKNNALVGNAKTSVHRARLFLRKRLAGAMTA